MSFSVARDIYEGFKRIVTMEERIERLVKSVDTALAELENHAERLARLEGKFELLENTLSSRRWRLPGSR